MNLIERIGDVNYIQLGHYIKVCKELKNIKYDYEKLLDAIHNEDLNTANSEMSNKVCGTCKKYTGHICPDMKCEALENSINVVKEERDEFMSENHDLRVMVATLLYVLGVRE